MDNGIFSSFYLYDITKPSFDINKNYAHCFIEFDYV